MKQTDSISEKSFAKLIVLAVLSQFVPLLLLLLLFLLDYSNPPLIWQINQQKDKQAILRYVRAEYGDEAELVDQRYPLFTYATYFGGFSSRMTFNYKGTEFTVYASDGGHVYLDNYSWRKESYFMYSMISDDFFKPRNIEVEYRYDFSEKFQKDVNFEDYNGTFTIGMNDYITDSAKEPRDIDWYYDFYLYLKEPKKINHYTVKIVFAYSDDSGYEMIFDEDSEFGSREDFYAAFEKVSCVEYVEYDNLVSDNENQDE